MPRSEENRCLHCGSRLPLIRKLRDGQFCTAAHRKAYLANQQELALERLSAASLANLAAATAPVPGLVEETVSVARAGGPPPTEPPSWEPSGFARPCDVAGRQMLTAHVERYHIYWALRRNLEIGAAQIEPLPLTLSVEIFEPLLAARPACGPAQAGPVRYGRWPEPAGSRPRHAAPVPLTLEYLDLPLPPTPLRPEWAWNGRLAASRWTLPPLVGDRTPFARFETAEPSDRPSWFSLRVRPVSIEWDWMDLVPPRTDLAALSPGEGLRGRAIPAGGHDPESAAPPVWRPALPITPAGGAWTCTGPVPFVAEARAAASRRTLEVTGIVPAPGGVEYPVRPSRRWLSPAGAGTRIAVPAPRPGTAMQTPAAHLPLPGFVMRPVRAVAPAVAAPPVSALRPGFPVRNPYVPAPKAPPLRPAGRPDHRDIPVPATPGWIRLQTHARMQGARPVLRVELAMQAFPLPGLRPRLRVEPVEVHLEPRAGIPVAGRSRPAVKPLLSIHTEPGGRGPLAGMSLAGFWSNAPRDLKMMTLSLPLLLLLAIKPSLPKVAVAAPGDLELKRTIQTQWGAVQQNISSRAGIEYSDDFRAGLDQWDSRGDLTTEWAYDAAGFVHPGPLAIFKPTLGLQNYSSEFLGMVDQKALGFVFRAADLDNYQAVKLTVVRAGPLPTIALVRYPVIGGKAEEAKTTILPITVRRDTLYRVRVDVRDDNFAVTVQGTLVDFWSDARLRTGGIGFFAGKGEESRVRWVQVSHQYDALGRLCAFLAPYNLQAGNGSFKP